MGLGRSRSSASGQTGKAGKRRKTQKSGKARSARRLAVGTLGAVAAAATVASFAVGPQNVPGVKLTTEWFLGVGGNLDGPSENIQYKIGGDTPTKTGGKYATKDGQQYVAVKYPGSIWPTAGLDRETFQQSIIAGNQNLNDEAVALLLGQPYDSEGNKTDGSGATWNEEEDHLTIVGYSLGSLVANKTYRQMAEHYSEADVDFVFMGFPDTPNGGIMARFPWLNIPFIDIKSDGPLEPGPFETTVINTQYDMYGDFPEYPNVIAIVNALMGIQYAHPDPYYDAIHFGEDDQKDITNKYDRDGVGPVEKQYEGGTENTDYLDPTGVTKWVIDGTADNAKTTYYLVHATDLPILMPFHEALDAVGLDKQLGFLVDTVDPLMRVFIEAGYDRDVSPGEATGFSLFIPTKVIVNAVNQLPGAIDTGSKTFQDGVKDLLGISHAAQNPVGNSAPEHQDQQQKPAESNPSPEPDKVDVDKLSDTPDLQTPEVPQEPADKVLDRTGVLLRAINPLSGIAEATAAVAKVNPELAATAAIGADEVRQEAGQEVGEGADRKDANVSDADSDTKDEAKGPEQLAAVDKKIDKAAEAKVVEQPAQAKVQQKAEVAPEAKPETEQRVERNPEVKTQTQPEAKAEAGTTPEARQRPGITDDAKAKNITKPTWRAPQLPKSRPGAVSDKVGGSPTVRGGLAAVPDISDAKPADTATPGEAKTSDAKPAESKSSDAKSASDGAGKAADATSGSPNAGTHERTRGQARDGATHNNGPRAKRSQQSSGGASDHSPSDHSSSGHSSAGGSSGGSHDSSSAGGSKHRGGGSDHSSHKKKKNAA